MRGRARHPNQLKKQRGKLRHWPALALAVVFALGLAVPALAAYIGPDRDYTVTVTESETVPDPENDRWTLTGPEGSCIILHPCSQHPGTVSYIPACGWSGPADNSSCTPAFKTIETTRTETRFHPEASVSGSIQCAQNGANGWCIGSGSIELGANEPLGGYSILGIEGTLDGNTFFCPGTSCSVPGSPGSASASYWALSSYGDSSSMGSSTLKIDADLPTIAGVVSGAQGGGGWYVGDISLTAVGADATSGLAAQQVQVDGGAWQNTGATISSDGTFSVVFRAIDQAGQESYTAAQTLNRDTAPPSISLDAYDAPARGGAMVAGSASDATSGVAAVHFSVNGSLDQRIATSGGAWQLHWDSTEVPNGSYTLQVYAEDQAGHYSAPVQVGVQVDNAVPYINLSSACWPIWQALDLDTGPGAAPISLVSLTVSDGSRSLTEIFSAPPQDWIWSRTFSDGSVAPAGDYSLQVYVEDASGNSSSRGACIRIPAPDAAGFSTEDSTPQTSTLQSFVPSGEPGLPPSPSFANAQPSVTVITELQPQPAFIQQLQQATPANAAVWGPAALTLAAAATAIAMAEKNRREEEERRRNEPDPQASYPNGLLAAHLSDKEVMAQVLAAGANPNISIEQARLITHNALKGKGSYSPTGAELNEKARKAAQDTQVGGGAYTVQTGDNWFSIAEKVYGNQRMAGQLMDANGGVSMLRPGQTIALPVVSGTEAASPNFDPKTWEDVVKFTLAQEALRKEQEEKPSNPPPVPQLPEGPAGLELALRMLANGSLTPAAFHALFPHVDLANAIYAANTGQVTSATVEWLWRENMYSQVALQQKQEDVAALRKGLIDLQARDITEAELLEMFPNLPIDQALAMLNNPEGLYNLWMTEVGRAWITEVEDRKNRERGWEATAQRYQGLADAWPTIQMEDSDRGIDWPSNIRANTAEALDLAHNISMYRALEFNQAGIYTNLRIDPSKLPWYALRLPGRANNLNFLRSQTGYMGTRYLSSNIPNLPSTRASLGFLTKSNVALAFASSVVTNAYEFTLGSKEGDASDIAASVAVDTGVNLAIAALVAGGLLIVGAPAIPIVMVTGFIAAALIGIGVDIAFGELIQNTKDDLASSLRPFIDSTGTQSNEVETMDQQED